MQNHRYLKYLSPYVKFLTLSSKEMTKQFGAVDPINFRHWREYHPSRYVIIGKNGFEIGSLYNWLDVCPNEPTNPLTREKISSTDILMIIANYIKISNKKMSENIKNLLIKNLLTTESNYQGKIWFAEMRLDGSLKNQVAFIDKIDATKFCKKWIDDYCSIYNVNLLKKVWLHIQILIANKIEINKFQFAIYSDQSISPI